jgi:hypothetical protein
MLNQVVSRALTRPEARQEKPYCVVVWENRNMWKQAANDGVEDETPTPDATLRPEVPDDGQRQDFELVEDPETEEEPDGYGHGV